MSLFTLSLIFLVCWFLCSASQSRQTIDKDLKFKSDGTFRIVQFTDLHFGEGEDLDENSMSVQRTILKAEQPDLVVITGDAVSGYAWDRSKDWYKAQWEKWTSPMQDPESLESPISIFRSTPRIHLMWFLTFGFWIQWTTTVWVSLVGVVYILNKLNGSEKHRMKSDFLKEGSNLV